MQENCIKYSLDMAEKRGNQIQYLLRRSTSWRTNEIWGTRIVSLVEILALRHTKQLQSRQSSRGPFYTPLRPLNPSHSALLLCGPVSWFSCESNWLLPDHRGSDVGTLCRRTNQPLSLLGTWWMKNSSSQTHSNTLQMMNNYRCYYLPRRRFSQRLETRSFSSTSKNVQFHSVKRVKVLQLNQVYFMVFITSLMWFISF